LSVERLASLKLRWRVSMAALLFRAKTLGLIAPRRYSYLWTQMSSAGYRIQEPHEEYLEDESPALERDLIAFQRNELHYSTAEIASALDETELEIDRRYGTEAKLKVI
jgi:Zn-dependent peptidase ImmA (M78 family)